MTSYIKSVTFDCEDVLGQAAFWAATLGSDVDQDSTQERRRIRSQRFLLDATVTGGELGTTERGGTTDLAKWVPMVGASELSPRADIIKARLRRPIP